MSNQDSKPVVLLIYANTGQPLAYLKEETDTIAGHLKASGPCDVVIVPAATLTDVVATLNDAALCDRIVVVHYAGHANGQGIQLGSEKGHAQGELAHMRGFAKVLERQRNLRLFFINGCASREQVLELTQAGIPLVIATNRGINDKVARDFADHFYRTLGQERSIDDAFHVAAGTIQADRGKNTRDLYFGDFQRSKPAQDKELPWELHGPGDDRRWALGEPYDRETGEKWKHTKYEYNQASPYLGLHYFAEEDSDRFFGRDDFVRDLLVASETAPLLLVTGASGTGKSSVVRAGVIPAWKERHRDAGSPRAFVFTPEDDPFDQLSASLVTVDTVPAKTRRDVREPSPTALRDALTTFAEGEPWLFFIDQFEQIFTRTKDKKKRAEFLDSITDLARTNDPNVCLVLAMRDDFFPQLRDYPELFPFTDKHFFRVAALDRRALEEVVRRPAAEHGVKFEEGLVDDIIDAVDGQPGALPLLQYTLDALWKKDKRSDFSLHKSTYDHLGGVTESPGGVMGSLGRRFEELYNQRDEAGKDEFRWMMLKLVTYDQGGGGAGFVSRLAPKSEFTGQQAELLNQLISEEKLLVSSGTSIPSVQLGHEMIIEAWPEYAKWMRDHREANSVRQRLSNAASEWTKLKREPTKAARALWQGSQLEKALELRKRGDFEQLGGLDPQHHRFLDASYGRSRRLIRGLQWAIGAAIIGAILIAIVARQLSDTNKKLGKTNQELIAKEKEANDQRAKAIAKEGEANEQRATALSQRNIATARQLAAEAELLALQEPHLIGQSALLAVESLTLTETPEGNRALRESLALLPHLKPTMTFLHRLFDVELSPDDRYLGAGDESGTIKIYDRRAGRLVHVLEQEGGVNALVFSPAKEMFATAHTKTTTQAFDGSPAGAAVWDISSGKRLATIPHRDEVEHCAFSPDGRYLATASQDKTAMLFEFATSKNVAVVTHESFVGHVAFTPDSKYFATSSGDKTVKVWEVPSGDKVSEAVHGDTVWRFEFNEDGTLFASGTSNGELSIWETKSGTNRATFRHNARVGAVAWSPEGDLLAAACDDDTCRLYDWRENRLVSILSHQPGRWSVRAVSFDATGRFLVTCGDDFTARVWDVSGNELLRITHRQEVADACFTTDGHVISVGWDGNVRTADLNSAREIDFWWNREDGAKDTAVSADGAPVVTTCWDEELRLWNSESRKVCLSDQVREGLPVFTTDANTLLVTDSEYARTIMEISATDGQIVREFDHEFDVPESGPEPQRLLQLVQSSRTDKFLATAFSNESPWLWDFQNATKIGVLSDSRHAESMAFSPDERLIAVGDDSELCLYATADCSRETSVHLDDDVKGVAFACGKYLYVTGGLLKERFANVYEVMRESDNRTSLTLKKRLEIPDGVVAMDLSSDGRFLATVCGANSGFFQVWRVPAGTKLLEFSNKGVVSSGTTLSPYPFAQFSLDNQYLLTGGYSNTARLWRTSDFKEVSRFVHPDGHNWVYGKFSHNSRELVSMDRSLRVCLYRNADLIVEAHARLRIPDTSASLQSVLVFARTDDLKKAKQAYLHAVAAVPELSHDASLRKGLTKKLLGFGSSFVKKGKVDSALAAYALAEQIGPEYPPSAEEWNTLCRYGSLWGHAAEVLFAGDKAVAAEPEEPRFRDSRGFARAVLEDFDGAIEDFRYYIEHHGDRAAVATRRDWVEQLEQRKTPFTKAWFDRIRYYPHFF